PDHITSDLQFKRSRRQKLELSLPQILHRRRDAFDVIVAQGDVAGLGPQAHADALGRAARVADLVLRQRHLLRLALHVDPDAGVPAAVHDTVVFEPVAVRREGLAPFGPEQDADVAAAHDLVVAYQVVRVAMADGNAVTAIVLDAILLGEPVLDAPAEEEADVVAAQHIVAHDRALRAGAGMQAE